MACNVPYIRSSYAGNPELIQKLEEINNNIWDEINSSKLFREYGKERLFSKPNTEQFKKQREFIKKINRKYNTPSPLSLIHAKVTKSGYNHKVSVTVHPIAEQVWYTTDAAKKLQLDSDNLGIDEHGDSNTLLLANKQEHFNTTDPELKTKYFSEGDETTSKEILLKIANSDHPLSPLAKKLYDLDEDPVPVRLIHDDGIGENKVAAGAFYPTQGRIEIAEFARFKGLGSEPSIIHEVLHAMSYTLLHTDVQLSRDFNKLYKAALQYKDQFTDQYPLTDVDEFLTGIFTNSEFINELKSIPAVEGVKYNNLWEQILDFFKNLFHISEDKENLFEQAIAVGSHIISETAEELKSFKEFSSLSDEQFLANERAGSKIAQQESGEVKVNNTKETPEEIAKRITDISNDITKGPGKLKNKKTGEEEDVDRYFYKGKQIKFRVSDKVHDLYDRLFRGKELTKDEYTTAIEEFHREKGVLGHADLQHLATLMIDKSTHKLLSEEDFIKAVDEDSKYEPQIGNDEIYEKLKSNLWQRLNSFPEGTLFYPELSIMNDTIKGSEIGGTIDLLALSPDKINGGTKVSILDWKFMKLNTNRYTDVPWYKIKTWNLQMSIYKRILEQNYNISPSQFEQTRMIPIVAEYENVYDTNNHKWKNTLSGIKIGDANPENISDNEDYLLPVGIEGETTGDKNLDELIRKLNAQYKRLEDQKVDETGKFEKAIRLNTLFRAIRLLRVKKSIEPLLIQVDAINSEMQKLVEEYNNNLKDKNLSNSDTIASDFLDRAIEVEKDLDLVSSLNNYIKNIHDKLDSVIDKTDAEIEKDKKLISRINAAVVSSGANKAELDDIIKQFTSDAIDNKFGKFDILSPEKIVSAAKRMFKTASAIPISTVRAMQRLAAQVKNKADLNIQEDFDTLNKLRKDYDEMAKAKGFTKKTYYDPIRKKKENKLIDQFDSEFYKTLQAKIDEGDIKWIQENTRWDEYKKYQLEQLEVLLKRVDTSPSYGLTTDENGNSMPEDNEQREKARQRLREQYNFGDKNSFMYRDYKILRRFPTDNWESTEYKDLKANPAAFNFYNYILQLNERLAEMGYIESYEARYFLPYMRASLVENIVMGKKPSLIKKAINDISVDPSTPGYGKIDPLTGEVVNSLPTYYTTEIPFEETSSDLFSNLLILSHSANRFKYLSEVEGIVQGLLFVERNKGVLKTNKYNKVVFKKDNSDEPEIDNNNTLNVKIYEEFMADLIYGQKYTGENSMDALFGNLSKLGEKINKKLGRKVFPEGEDNQNVSMIRTVEGLNKFFYLLHLNPLNILSPLSNYFGGSIQTAINAGELFSKNDFGSAMLRLLPGWFDIQRGLGAAEKMIKMIDYFMPYTESVIRDKAAELSRSKFNETNVNNAFFYTMRGSDRKVQAATLLALLSNTIVINGRMFNVNDYVKGKKEYRDRYKNGNVKEVEKKAKQEIKELKEKYSLEKLSKINDKGEFEIEGISRSSQDIHEIRRLTEKISQDALGNMSEADTRGMNHAVATKSMMMFKNWIPRLVETRFGELNQIGSNEYEWGRVVTWFKFAGTNFLQAGRSIIGYSLANEKGISALRELYEKQAKTYKERNGKDWTMTEDQFFDMVRQNIHNDMKDFLATAALISLFFLAKGLKSMAPDDDDPRVKSSFAFMVRVMDKLSDEVSFYYSPDQAASILSGGIFPSVGVLVNGLKVFEHFATEMFGLVTKNDELVESNKPTKYILRSLPFTKQMTDMLPLFAPETAKELGIRIQATNDIH